MKAALRLLSLGFFFCHWLHSSVFISAVVSQYIRGLHYLDLQYYFPFQSELIECKDKSNTFTRDRINDDFCDCVDGTDEPGTSACPMGRFFCLNWGSNPQFLFSSRVNDQICDCCDGSDEYDGSMKCPNTCGMERRERRSQAATSARKKIYRARPDADDLKFMFAAMVQWVVLAVLIALFAFHIGRQNNRSRRRRNH